MAGPWDSVMKKMLRANPEHFVSWLLPDAHFVALEDVELQQQHRFADGLAFVETEDGPSLLHAEVQTYHDPKIGQRLQTYNLMAWDQYDLPVTTYVICMVPTADVPDPPFIRRDIEGDETHRFQYRPMRMWREETKRFLRTNGLGVLPLVLLTKDGKDPEVVKALIERLVVAKEYDLLAMAQVIGGLVFKKPPEQEAFRKRFGMFQDIISESWVYQEIVEEGLRKGLEQGLKQGQKQGLEKALHQMLQTYMETRYPQLVVLAQQRTNAIADPTLLNQIVSTLFALQTTEEVEHYLLTLGNDATKN